MEHVSGRCEARTGSVSTQIGEVCLLTNDVKRLAGFYRRLFHMPDLDGDAVHQFVLTEGTALAIYNDGTVKNNHNQNICLAFTVEDVDAEWRRLSSLGVPIIQPPASQPWGARNMQLLDPDGNPVFLRSFPAP